MNPTGTAPSDAPDPFDLLAAAVRRRAAAAFTDGKPPLFSTAAPDLYPAFLDALAPALRQEHACSACRRFVDRYGLLVTIDDAGHTTPLLWAATDDIPGPYAAAVTTLADLVRRAPIEGIFLAAEETWGSAPTPDKKRDLTWTHLALPSPHRFQHPLSTAHQIAAAKREEHAMLLRGLAEFPPDLVRKARALLDTDALYRSEKCLGVATWLLDLHDRRERAPSPRHRDHLTWLAVATAPPGFCHVRSTMIGTLLEDLAADLPFDSVKARFAEKMHPLRYLRPQSAPDAGNIAQAEKIVEKLKSAGALARRFARLDDLQPLWKPAPPVERAAKPGAVFAHIQPKGSAKNAAALDAPPAVMTWDKFARTVLPGAERIECLIPPGKQPFLAFVTAADPAAAPIVQWDREDRRNPVTWYVYVGGSEARDWNLTPGAFHPVTAVSLPPYSWDSERSYSHHGKVAVFLLDGARDLRHSAGGGLFPEHLKSEYHAVRKTLEAHFNGAAIAGKDDATACGLALQASAGKWDFTFRVTSKGLKVLYKLDRWD